MLMENIEDGKIYMCGSCGSCGMPGEHIIANNENGDVGCTNSDPESEAYCPVCHTADLDEE